MVACLVEGLHFPHMFFLLLLCLHCAFRSHSCISSAELLADCTGCPPYHAFLSFCIQLCALWSFIRELFPPLYWNIAVDRAPNAQAWLVFGDEECLAMFADVYASAMARLRPADAGWAARGWLGEVHLHSGVVTRPWISSLSAFWPGLQALIGARCRRCYVFVAQRSSSLIPAHCLELGVKNCL